LGQRSASLTINIFEYKIKPSIMKLFVFMLFVFAASFPFGKLYCQAQNSSPAPHRIKVGQDWTLLSSEDNLVFEAMTGTCNGATQLLLKVQNNWAKEVHVFISLSVEGGIHRPRQLLILKANQIADIGCKPSVPFMPIHLQAGQEPVVTLDYKINKTI